MIIKVHVPTINTNDDDATITVWYVESGSYVEQGDPIAALETTKAAVEVEAEASGHVYYRWPLETQIPVGEVLAILSPTPLTAEELEQCYAVVTAKQDEAEGGDTLHKPLVQEQAQPGKPLNQNVSSESMRKVTVKARQLIKHHGLSENDFPGTDKITTAMVKSLLDRQRSPVSEKTVTSLPNRNSSPVPEKAVPGYLEKLALSEEKRQEIEALVSSQKQVVQSEVSIDIEWESFERQLAALSHSNAFRFSPGDLITYHCARLLPQYPYLNGVYYQDQAYRHKAVNVGYAVNLGQGLRVPVLRHADQKGLLALAKEIREYTMKYTQGRITNKECSQGSFTITDLSSKRIKDFRPVLNTMQAAILGISGVVEGAINLILGFDHRLADGALAADFLQELKTRLESQETAVQPPLASVSEQEAFQKPPAILPKAAGDLDKKQVQADVVALFARVLSIETAAVELDRELESYHLSSKTIVQITSGLADHFEGVPASFLFEHRTIRSVIQCLLGESKPQTGKDWASFSRELPAKKGRKLSYVEEEGIAIIGVAGRYPQAGNLAELWQCLRDGQACFREVPQSRWEMESFYAEGASRGGKSYCKWGGFLDGVDRFDALFFGISPREAEMMDPQQRLFLEVVWEMMEDAGYTRQALPRRTGIYVGIISGDYGIFESQAVLEGNDYYRLADYYQVPNRISYHLDLTGPSLAIDTACSASGAAVHLACESLKRNECETAIVGGVNLILHPSRFIQYSQMQILSRQPQLGPFSEQSDGTLLGEGAGALLLKPLPQAIRDRDNIYGQIRATAINSGGKTNGFTVPNPQAQAQLIRTAIERADIDSRAISYVEAHGTGTPLGDSVEIRGLSLAFEQATQQQEKQHCALGSIKSNIGHLESNAAIAGITKVLLQMKHGLLVPSLHAQTLNSSIAFEQTPFKVQQELTDWKRPHLRKGDKTVEYPRIAGISSFGAGGSNAHIILQEHEPAASSLSPETDEESFLMPLSAKTTDQLQGVVERLLMFCSGVNGSLPSLRDIAFTLQTGRESMKARVVFVVKSLADWQERLQSFLDGQTDAPGIFKGRNQISLTQLSSDDNGKRQQDDSIQSEEEADLEELVQTYLNKRNLAKLARFWASGMRVDWNLLYAESDKPSRVSLPTYPFVKERYWIESVEPGRAADRSQASLQVSILHPLLHQNTSDLSEQRFSSRFTGQEFFFNHHQVNGEKLFPGLCYLEMARAAVEKSLGRQEKGAPLRLKNVVWFQPPVVNGSTPDVHIALIAESKGRIQYEVYSESGGEDDTIVHSQGIAELAMGKAAPALDLPQLKSQMKHGVLNTEACYQAFESMGFHYGPERRGIREIYRGEQQLLATLHLPSSIQPTLNDFVLHPGLMDAVLQAGIGLTLDCSVPAKPGLPSALESLEIFDDCGQEMLAWIRYVNGSKATDSEQKLDIDLCDPQGHVCVKMKGFTTTVANQAGDSCEEIESTEPTPVPPLVFMFAGQGSQYGDMGKELYEKEPVFKSLMNDVNRQVKAITGKDLLHSVYVSGSNGNDTTETGGGSENEQLLLFALEYALSRFLIAGGIKPSALIGYSFGEYLAACLSGVFTLEEILRLILRRNELLEKAPEGMLLSIPCSAQELEPFLGSTTHLAIDNGISCVVAGGLEAMEELQQQMKKKRYFCVPVRVPYAIHSILMEPLLAELEATLDEFELKPPQIPFVSNLTGTWITAEQATDKRYWSDHFKSTVRFAQGLKRILEDKANTVFVEIGPGRELSLLAERMMENGTGVRIIDTIRPGHRQVSDVEYLSERLQKLSSLGITLDQTVFNHLSVSTAKTPLAKGTATEADTNKVSSLVRPPSDLTGFAERGKRYDERQQELEGLTLEQSIAWDLKEHVSVLLKLPRDRFDLDTHLADLGFDSIFLGHFALTLSDYYQLDITPAVFFSFPTLKKLTHHFFSKHQTVMASFYQVDQNRKETAREPAAKKSRVDRTLSLRTSLPTGSSIRSTVSTDPVAIIGMSGRFPQSRNIEELWQILAEEKEAISEYPLERFDWRFIRTEKPIAFRCGSLPGVKEFDAKFFEISPQEAEDMDPRQRLLLQESWKALEDAGYGPEQVKAGKIGMFVGIESGDYGAVTQGQDLATANHDGILAARLAYFMDLKGPAMAINTSCSSGLVAAHQACLSIRSQECETAIAAGVHLNLTPNLLVINSQSGMLSTDGKCYAFDKRANGMVMAEALAVVVLKSLSRAQADGDPIYAVIKGSGINYDGKSNGITAPSGIAQYQLLKSVYDQFRIDPETIEHVVTHGTGTKLGDLIEINALQDAYQSYTGKQGYCAVTSNKTNLGHTAAPAGLVSLIGLVQSIRYQTIPASLNCEEENNAIDWKQSPFFVNKTTKPWSKPNGTPRIGAVSSFGMSGTNAHMVVQEFVSATPSVSGITAPSYLLVFSAKSAEALQGILGSFINAFENRVYSDQDLPLISYTLLCGRHHFAHRLALNISDLEEAVCLLKQHHGKKVLPNLFRGVVNRDFSEQKSGTELVHDLLEMCAALLSDQVRYRDNLNALAELFCQGYDIPWQQLHKNEFPTRLHLPTYAFSREEYWADTSKTAPTSTFQTGQQLHPLLQQKPVKKLLRWALFWKQ